MAVAAAETLVLALKVLEVVDTVDVASVVELDAGAVVVLDGVDDEDELAPVDPAKVVSPSASMLCSTPLDLLPHPLMHLHLRHLVGTSRNSPPGPDTLVVMSPDSMYTPEKYRSSSVSA